MPKHSKRLLDFSGFSGLGSSIEAVQVLLRDFLVERVLIAFSGRNCKLRHNAQTLPENWIPLVSQQCTAPGADLGTFAWVPVQGLPNIGRGVRGCSKATFSEPLMRGDVYRARESATCAALGIKIYDLDTQVM